MSSAILRTLVRPAVACGLLVLTLGAGCRATGKSAIPAGAEEVDSGRGELVFEPMRDGRVWVYDAETNKMVYTGPVRDGDRVRVNPKTNQITVGGQTVS